MLVVLTQGLVLLCCGQFTPAWSVDACCHSEHAHQAAAKCCEVEPSGAEWGAAVSDADSTRPVSCRCTLRTGPGLTIGLSATKLGGDERRAEVSAEQALPTWPRGWHATRGIVRAPDVPDRGPVWGRSSGRWLCARHGVWTI